MIKMYENDDNLLDISNEVTIDEVNNLYDEYEYKHDIYLTIQTQKYKHFRFNSMFDNGIFIKTISLLECLFDNMNYINEYKITLRVDMGHHSDSFVVGPKAACNSNVNIVEYDASIFSNKDLFYDMIEKKINNSAATSTLQIHIRYNVNMLFKPKNIVHLINKVYNIFQNQIYLTKKIISNKDIAYCILFENINSSLYDMESTGIIKTSDMKKIFTDIYVTEYEIIDKETKKFVNDYTKNNKLGFPEPIMACVKNTGSKFKRYFKSFTDNVHMTFEEKDNRYELTFHGTVHRINVYYPVTLCEYYERTYARFKRTDNSVKNKPVFAYINELIINDMTMTHCKEIYGNIKVKTLKLFDYEPEDVLYILQSIDVDKVYLIHKVTKYVDFDYDEPSIRRQYKNPNVVII